MATFTVNNLNAAGAGSLQAAINAANASLTPSVIDFSVAGTITLPADLPAISQHVTIDATTAPGYAGAPVVELNCNSNGGLVFAAGSAGSQLLGMAVVNAAGNGVTLDAGSITLNNNYIGLNLSGVAFGNGGDGIFVSATSANNQIGLNPSGASGVVANVISGNGGNGISFHGSAGNTVVANRIGTSADGTTAIGNGGNGIWVTDASNGNTIGGTEFVDSNTGQENNPTGDKGTAPPVFVVPPLGNLVSGNGQSGILIDANSQYNVLNGNFVGTTADGNTALGNAWDGVWINGANNNSLIGCQFVNNPFVYYNVVSGNGGNGLQITDSDNATVQANFFGVGANNASIVANQLDGILVEGTSANTQVGGVIPLGNVSAGNGLNGIEVTDTVNGFITFNTFGGLYAFGGAAPNGNDGLLITSTGGNNTVQTNVFSGNTNNGIELSGDASGVTVDPNIAGMNTIGNAALPNGNNGLQISGTAHGNTIGGYQSSVIPENAFSGNGGYGVAVLGQAYDNQIFNDYIGTDVMGLAAIPNAAGGILVGDTASNITIGGTSTDPSAPTTNLISGNTGNGVTLDSGTSYIQLLNNWIGLDRAGFPLLPNTGSPIVTNGSTNDTIEGNVIACFAAGTRIATQDGAVAVEALRIGDPVRSVLRETCVPVTWIGRRQIDCRRHPDPRAVWPVRIAADAFGPGLPVRDVFLSPDHAVFAEGVLIPVKHLVNGTTIQQVETDRVSYYHVELARHDVLLAEGLPAESYLDTGDRDNFANGDHPVRLFACFAPPAAQAAAVWEARGCARLVVHGPELAAVRARIAAAQPAGAVAKPPVRRKRAA